MVLKYIIVPCYNVFWKNLEQNTVLEVWIKISPISKINKNVYIHNAIIVEFYTCYWLINKRFNFSCDSDKYFK